MRPELGKTYRKVYLHRHYPSWDNTFVFGLDWFKMKQYPPEGQVAVRGRDYDGVMFVLKFKSPVWIERWR